MTFNIKLNNVHILCTALLTLLHFHFFYFKAVILTTDIVTTYTYCLRFPVFKHSKNSFQGFIVFKIHHVFLLISAFKIHLDSILVTYPTPY